MDDRRRTRVRIDGRVQGVFFRVSCAREATARGVSGWVRNMPDGGVEAVFEGRRSAVEAMVAWCEQGPPGAAVQEVERSDEAVEGLTRFDIWP